jgi:hypothetical protein
MTPTRVVLSVLALVGALLGSAPVALAGGQAAPPSTAPAQIEPLPVPDWLAWRVLHDSLAFYRTGAAAAVEAMLAERTGLARTEVGAFFEAGAAFLATLRQLDAGAAAEIEARYGRPPPRRAADTPPRPGSDAPMRPAIRLEPGTTLFDAVQASGLYDAIEAQKAAALAAHLEALTALVGATTMDRLAALVETTVRPTIYRGVVRPPAPSVPELPPGARREPPADDGTAQ